MDNGIQKLEDFELLKKIVIGKIRIEDLDDSTKIRLINLCDERIQIVNNRTKETKKKINDIEKIIKKIEQKYVAESN